MHWLNAHTHRIYIFMEIIGTFSSRGVKQPVLVHVWNSCLNTIHLLRLDEASDLKPYFCIHKDKLNIAKEGLRSDSNQGTDFH